MLFSVTKRKNMKSNSNAVKHEFFYFRFFLHFMKFLNPVDRKFPRFPPPHPPSRCDCLHLFRYRLRSSSVSLPMNLIRWLRKTLLSTMGQPKQPHVCDGKGTKSRDLWTPPQKRGHKNIPLADRKRKTPYLTRWCGFNGMFKWRSDREEPKVSRVHGTSTMAAINDGVGV